MEAGEYGLTRVTCFLACRLELDSVAGLLWISWCVFGGGGGFFRVFFFRFFFFLRTHTACCKNEAASCLIYLSTSNEAICAYRQKKTLHAGVRTECHFLISLSVCVRVCVTFVVFNVAVFCL